MIWCDVNVSGNDEGNVDGIFVHWNNGTKNRRTTSVKSENNCFGDVSAFVHVARSFFFFIAYFKTSI